MCKLFYNYQTWISSKTSLVSPKQFMFSSIRVSLLFKTVLTVRIQEPKRDVTIAQNWCTSPMMITQNYLWKLQLVVATFGHLT